MTRSTNILQVRSIAAARPRATDYYLNDGARLAVRVYPSGRKTSAIAHAVSFAELGLL